MIARSLLDQSAAGELKIFYSYSRRDESWRQEIDRLLPEFQLDVAVRTWFDGDIEPGREWAPEIDRNLAAADLILLFVGQAFVESQYCREVEVPAAMRRHANGDARVIPIILEPTTPDWRQLEFARLQCLPGNGVPVSAWDDRRRALEAVVQGLVQLVVNQGIRPETRMRWELHLEGDAALFSVNDRSAATVELRRATADPTLRCVSVSPGSTVLTIESAQDAMAWASRAFTAGELRTLLGREVKKVLGLFGSSMQAISSARARRLASPPDVERMLLPSRRFDPTQIRCMVFDPENPLASQNLIVSKGDSALEGDALGAETAKLLDYFKTALAVPEGQLYVNLAPNHSAKLLSPLLSGTRMGAGLLEFDYRLKRLAASLLHPDLDIGRRFWAEVMRRCRGEASGFDAPPEVPAFQRVWMIPDKATVYEGPSFATFERHMGLTPDPLQATRAFAAVLDQHVKAVTEREYAGEHGDGGPTDRISIICDEVFREIVLPAIQTEVDEGENFAELRQIVRGTILAIWFKKQYGTHPKVAKYVDSGRPGQLGVKVVDITPWPSPSDSRPAAARHPMIPAGVSAATASGPGRVRSSPEYQLPENREYFERYMDVFEKGVFYVERDELVEGTGLKRARAYFSGAIDLRRTRDAIRHV